MSTPPQSPEPVAALIADMRDMASKDWESVALAGMIKDWADELEAALAVQVFPPAAAHIVQAGTEYEGHSDIAVFIDKDAADQLAALCQAYPAQPQYPEDTNDDVAWEAAEIAIKAWRESHPAGKQHTGADYYSVETVPLRSALPVSVPPAETLSDEEAHARDVLGLLLSELAFKGWQALPCRVCQRHATVGVHDLHHALWVVLRSRAGPRPASGEQESAQPCGCDPGASWVCERHRDETR